MSDSDKNKKSEGTGLGLEETVRAVVTEVVNGALEKYAASLAGHASIAAHGAAQKVKGDLAGNFEELEEHLREAVAGQGERIRVAVKAEVASEVAKAVSKAASDHEGRRGFFGNKRDEPSAYEQADEVAKALMSGTQPAVQRLRAWIMDVVRDTVKEQVKDQVTDRVPGIIAAARATAPAVPGKGNPQGLRSFTYGAYGITADDAENEALAEGYRRFGSGAVLQAVLQAPMFKSMSHDDRLYGSYKIIEVERDRKVPGARTSYLVTGVYGNSTDELAYKIIDQARRECFGWSKTLDVGDYTVHDNREYGKPGNVNGRLYVDHVVVTERGTGRGQP